MANNNPTKQLPTMVSNKKTNLLSLHPNRDKIIQKPPTTMSIQKAFREATALCGKTITPTGKTIHRPNINVQRRTITDSKQEWQQPHPRKAQKIRLDNEMICDINLANNFQHLSDKEELMETASVDETEIPPPNSQVKRKRPNPTINKENQPNSAISQKDEAHSSNYTNQMRRKKKNMKTKTNTTKKEKRKCRSYTSTAAT